MFFRFASVLAVLVAIALTGVAIEKGNLELRRQISLQDYRRQQLVEQRARLHVRIEKLTAVAQEPVPASRTPQVRR